jgi:hypothetical protein
MSSGPKNWQPSRRLIAQTLLAVPVYPFVAHASRMTRVQTPLVHWIHRQNEIALALKHGELSGPGWAAEVENLGRSISPEEVLRATKAADLLSAGVPSYNDPQKTFVRFRDENGKPRKLEYGVALFRFHKDNVITPHVHRHMVSAHMVVAGAFRIRNFDRLGDEGNAVLVRPTRDYIGTVGHVSTMCSERDNGHWFVPQTDGSATFDVILSGLDRGQPDHEIQPIDPLHGIALANGVLRVPMLTFEESSRRYTREV